MSDRRFDPRDEPMASALRDSLAARDRAAPAPRFAAVWPSSSTGRSSTFSWRPAVAVAAAVAVAGLSWTWFDRAAAPESAAQEADSIASLAHELSAPDYWRVPTDQLLAFAAPRPSVDLPTPAGFRVSLEESML